MKDRYKTEPRAALTLQCEALSRLVNEFSGTLAARICGRKKAGPNSKSPTVNGNVKSYESFARPCTLRIVVYGRLETKTGVAKMLANEDLFLQEPSLDDIDDNIGGMPAMAVPYYNPQYLLVPGQAMPMLEELTMEPCCGSSDNNADPELPPSARNEILRIFDTTYDSIKATEVLKPSSRLVTQLKRCVPVFPVVSVLFVSCFIP